MSKSIKLKNNTYLDSSGVTHNRDLLSTLLTTLTGQVGGLSSQVTDLNNRIYIQETGSNANGNYIKWSNGLMVCYKKITLTLQCSSQWGSMYESQAFSFGNHAQEFIATPYVFVKDVGRTGIVEGIQFISKTSCGSTWIMRPTKDTSSNEYIFDYLAIGMWK